MLQLKDMCQVKDLMAAVVSVEAELRQRVGLNLNQSFALCCLNKGPRSAGALADELRIHGASLSRILKALTQKGYIRHELNTEDSRQKWLSLTEAGKALAGSLLVCESQLFPLNVDERGLAENA